MNLISSVAVSTGQNHLFFDWNLTFIILFGQILVTIWKDICCAFCQYFMLAQQTLLTQNQKKHPLNAKERQNKLFLINSVNFSKCFLVNPWDMKIQSNGLYVVYRCWLEQKLEQASSFYPTAVTSHCIHST